MNLAEHDIQRIVAEVVRRLTSMQSDAKLVSPGAIDSKTLHIEDKLITLAALRGRLQNTTTLSVPPGALVTPAVRDELKQRGVRLIRHGEAAANGQAKNNTGAKRSEVTLLAANVGSDYRAASLAQLVKSYRGELQTQTIANLTGVITEQTERVVRESCRAVWFTPVPAQAVCLANRHAGVWAVQGFDVASLRETLKGTAANVLAIDPRGKSQFVLRNMLEAFTNP
jgi:hypothetical protein